MRFLISTMYCFWSQITVHLHCLCCIITNVVSWIRRNSRMDSSHSELVEELMSWCAIQVKTKEVEVTRSCSENIISLLWVALLASNLRLFLSSVVCNSISRWLDCIRWKWEYSRSCVAVKLPFARHYNLLVLICCKSTNGNYSFSSVLLLFDFLLHI